MVPPLGDRLLAALDDFGPTGLDEQGATWRVFFASPADRDEAARGLREGFAGSGLQIDVEDVEDEDWAARGQAGLRAIRVGRFVVAPPWDIPIPDAPSLLVPGRAEALSHREETGPQLIVIQPSMGFGTGHHASTRLCLALLQRLDVRNRGVLDVGTGSAVLAIAARLLGAESVVAIDIDPDALQSARGNLQLNHLEDDIELRQADFRTIEAAGPWAVVVANLTAGLLTAHADALRRHVAPGGHLVIGGVMSDQESEVRVAFAPPGRLLAREADEGWVALLLAC